MLLLLFAYSIRDLSTGGFSRKENTIYVQSKQDWTFNRLQFLQSFNNQEIILKDGNNKSVRFLLDDENEDDEFFERMLKRAFSDFRTKSSLSETGKNLFRTYISHLKEHSVEQESDADFIDKIEDLISHTNLRRPYKLLIDMAVFHCYALKELGSARERKKYLAQIRRDYDQVRYDDKYSKDRKKAKKDAKKYQKPQKRWWNPLSWFR